MRRFPFLIAMASFALLSIQLYSGQILLDDVMTKEEQKKTGVKKLTYAQKVALESWLNKNFTLKTKTEETTPELTLSINIEDGRKLELSDSSIWEVAPNDISTAAIWLTPFPIKIAPSNDPEYPYLLINAYSGASVKARKVRPLAGSG
jgi:hypothetical protein